MNPGVLALVATFGPFVAFLISLLFFIRQTPAAKVLVLGAGAVTVLSALALFFHGPIEEPIRVVWFASGQFKLTFGFWLDSLALSFGAVVAVIAFMIQVYSLGYMSHDPDQPRFFAMLSLFLWSMLSFVYSSDFLQAFIFWELVGLASFFLIGFWYEKPSAVAAAKKAFIMTRIGDCGLFFGLLMILHQFHVLDLYTLVSAKSPLLASGQADNRALILGLIFLGVMGKSAQFPLHTWLPDAMEGPTPVSALLHSATMVAAGVFLFARLHPLYAATPAILEIVLLIAVFTAILSSTCAMVEPDIKKVLAYSSISQLGFMLLGLAAGSLFAGVFHLITHAFFKALLFLCAGAFIHGVDTNQLVDIGRRGGRNLVIPVIGLLVGGVSLAGVFPFSGFWSKEEILGSLHHGHAIVLAGAVFSAFLTAYYTGRMIFLVLFPGPSGHTHDGHDHGDAEHHHPHQPGAAMAVPIVFLTVCAIASGGAGRYIARLLDVETESHAVVVMISATVALILGVGLSWLDFGRKSAARVGFLHSMPALETFFRNGWYLDALYAATFGRLVNLFSSAMRFAEVELLDHGFDEFATGFRWGGANMAEIQNGLVQWYARTTVVMLGIFAIFIGLMS